MELISGEKLQELADVTHLGEINCNIPNQLKNTKTVTRNWDKFYLADNENIVFVYGHDLDLFFANGYKKINKPFKLISHNTDFPIDSRFERYLNDPFLIHWWGQNATYVHPKLSPLPIGIANSQWPHGNQEIIKAAMVKHLPKKYLVYKNFDISTNTSTRSRINEITNSNGIAMDINRPFTEYLDILKQSIFVISPPGNGIDCHRIWECLYMGATPVVQRNDCFRGFEDLPILWIDDWRNVSSAFLMDNVNRFLEPNRFINPILDLRHWVNKINNVKSILTK